MLKWKAKYLFRGCEGIQAWDEQWMVAITGKYNNWAYAAEPISSHEIHSNLERKGYKEKANLTARRLRFLGNNKAIAIILRPRSLAGNPRQSPKNKSAMPTL